MTTEQIITKARQLGVPSDYPLKGSKFHVIQRAQHFFQGIVDHLVIRGDGASAEANKYRDGLKAFNAATDAEAVLLKIARRIAGRKGAATRNTNQAMERTWHHVRPE